MSNSKVDYKALRERTGYKKPYFSSEDILATGCYLLDHMADLLMDDPLTKDNPVSRNQVTKAKMISNFLWGERTKIQHDLPSAFQEHATDMKDMFEREEEE